MIWVGIEVKLIPLNSINFRSEIREKWVQKQFQADAAARKKLFLKVSQYSQETTCVGVSF